MKVAVLGAGITGAVLTRALHEQGHHVVCLEASARTGGLCGSETIEGFVCDRAGGHIIYSKDEEVLRYVLEATSHVGHHTTERDTCIYEYGRHVSYPFENGLADLPSVARFECVRGYVEATFSRRNGSPIPDNFHDWCLWRFGEGISQHFMHPYNEKIWNVDLRDLGVEWVDGRVPDAPLEDVLRSALGTRTVGYGHQAIFHYPLTGGFESIVDGVLRHIPTGIVQTNSPCSTLEKTSSGWLVNGESYDRVISTIPLQELAKVLAEIPEDVASSFGKLDYTSLLTVFLALNRPEVPPRSWIYFPHAADGPQNRITYLSNYSPQNAPPGKSSIMAEVTFHGDLPATEEVITKQVIEGLVQSGMVAPAEIMWTRTFESRYAYILYRQDLETNLARVRAWCRSQELDIVGRFANYDYFNSDGCIRAALDLAATYAYLSGSGDQDQPKAR